MPAPQIKMLTVCHTLTSIGTLSNQCLQSLGRGPHTLFSEVHCPANICSLAVSTVQGEDFQLP